MLGIMVSIMAACGSEPQPSASGDPCVEWLEPIASGSRLVQWTSHNARRSSNYWPSDSTGVQSPGLAEDSVECSALLDSSFVALATSESAFGEGWIVDGETGTLPSQGGVLDIEPHRAMAMALDELSSIEVIAGSVSGTSFPEGPAIAVVAFDGDSELTVRVYLFGSTEGIEADLTDRLNRAGVDQEARSVGPGYASADIDPDVGRLEQLFVEARTARSPLSAAHG